MGVSDRYYMNGTEDSVNYTGRRFTAVNLLIIINIVVWVFFRIARTNDGLQVFLSQNFTVSADGVLNEYRFHTLLTSAISHVEPFHILFNLYFFWLVGEEVERIYGYRNFLVLYVFAGVIASLGHVAMNVVTQMSVPAIGASGAIMGVAVIAAIFNPNQPIVFMFFLQVPLRWLVIGYVMLDFFGLFNGMGPVANAGHLGGALAGLLFYKLDLRMFQSPGRAHVGLWRTLAALFRRKPRLRVVRPVPEELPAEPVAKTERALHASAGAAPSETRVDAATSRRVDELLGKISREGMSALTEEERTFLKESSQKYKSK